MIAAFLCGCFFGGLFCWERWARAERARHFFEVLDNLPPSDDEEWEDLLAAWDGEPWDSGTQTFTIPPNGPGITIDGIPYHEWMERFYGKSSGCADG